MARHLSIDVRTRVTIGFRFFTSKVWTRVLAAMPRRVRPNVAVSLRSRPADRGVLKVRVGARPTYRTIAREDESIVTWHGLVRSRC
jgi:hypothetical protein